MFKEIFVTVFVLLQLEDEYWYSKFLLTEALLVICSFNCFFPNVDFNILSI